jgi:hypothetical protein
MKARLIKNLIDTGSVARDFIRLVCGWKRAPASPMAQVETREKAQEVLESFRSHRRQRDTDGILTGKTVIRAMDEQLQDVGIVPTHLSSAGERFADWVTRGSLVSLTGDSRRFRVMRILWDRGSIRLRDDEGRVYVVPWELVRPYDEEEYGQ